jgi:hypothetical protein
LGEKIIAKLRNSYPENRKEVYKFWLGFCEKFVVLLFAAVIIPHIVGQLKYSSELLIIRVIFILVLFTTMTYISRRLWFLPKDDKKQDQAKNENQ